MKDPLLILEAVLFAAKTPLTEDDLKERLPADSDIPALLEQLQAHYEPRAIALVNRSGRWAFQTHPDYAAYLSHEKVEEKAMSRSALEVLATIAYHQPITRAEIEEIRGVSTTKGTLDQLMEQGWIKPGPRREEPGRPGTWLTTPVFCDAFGLSTLRELPGLEELREGGFLAANDVLPPSPHSQGELFSEG